MVTETAPGDIVWLQPDPAIGSEQRGRRPALVVSGSHHLSTFVDLIIVVPLTSKRRDWVNRVRVRSSGLECDSWAITEQVRTVSRERIAGRAGRTDGRTLAEVRSWVRDFLEL